MVDYAVLDVMIYFMDRDPWFNRILGSDERMLCGFPAGSLGVLVRPYRVVIGTLATFSVMDLSHVVLAIVSVAIGPRVLGTCGEPWMHPPLWGDPMELYRRGLPGTHPLSPISSSPLIPPTPIQIPKSRSNTTCKQVSGAHSGTTSSASNS